MLTGGVVTKVAVMLFALPASCFVLCSARVDPVHGWMMRHHCPVTRLTTHPPSHPMGAASRCCGDGTATCRKCP